jgi:diguanylate cyclase (GGDEF)-like protein/PAS domain S-box-containing protein
MDAEAERQPLRAIRVTRAARTPNANGLNTLAKLATISFEGVERELQAEIARLQAQTQRYLTAFNGIAQGFCVFDPEDRVVLSNRRYAEIYRFAPDQVRPGTTLREIVELRVAAGTCATANADAYLSFVASNNAAKPGMFSTAPLRDGRTIQVRHQPLPNGDWVSTHEDITELGAARASANQRLQQQTLIDWVPDYLWIKDTESRFVVANKALAVDSGRATTSDMIGLTDFDLHAPEAAQQFRAIEQAIIASGKPMIDREELVVDRSGAAQWLLSTKVPVRNERDETIGLVGIARDITAHKLAEVLRDGQAQILEMIAKSAPLRDVLEHLVRLVESQFKGFVGSVLLLEEAGTRLRCGAAPNLPASYAKAIEGTRIGPNGASSGTAVYRRETVVVADVMTDPLWRDYKHHAVELGFRSCWSTPVLSHQGAVVGIFAMYAKELREPTDAEIALVDVATRIAGIAIERKLAEDRIQFMADHDALTGLPNRTLLGDRLSQAVLRARRYDHWVTVLFVDLDNFKLVNDSLGHNAGDELLRTVAGRMVGCVTATDTVARLGGDEFVVVLSDQPRSADAISRVVKKIQSAIAEPVRLEGHELRVTSSIGIVNYPDDGVDTDTLMANADAAMYRAKDIGRDNVQFYTPELNTKVQEEFLLQEELRNALARSEFVLHYQPQVDLRTGRVFAAEALIRWNHPTLGIVPPIKFIPLAEETGLIVSLGDWVLREACRQNKVWQNAGLRPMSVSVNVSARQFRERDLVSRAAEALKESGLEAKYLELELTESLIMQDVELAIATMKELRGLGIQLSIDDFGTGYSSLSALKTFPVSRLKIDKSFIDGIPADENDKVVAGAVISLGQTLNLRVIAEGVETEEQAAFLRNVNCDEMQGFLFSKPLPAQEIEELLRTKSRNSSERKVRARWRH